MIKGARTIKQFKILEWIDANFERNSVNVVFDYADRATITDGAGGTMKVEFTPEGIKWEVGA